MNVSTESDLTVIVPPVIKLNHKMCWQQSSTSQLRCLRFILFAQIKSDLHLQYLPAESNTLILKGRNTDCIQNSTSTEKAILIVVR